MAGAQGYVTITSVANNSSTSVTISGQAYGDQYPASLVTLYYGLTSGSTTYSKDISLSGNGAYSGTLTGLSPSTLYYIYAREWDGNTFEYSSNTSFTTLAGSSKKTGSILFFM